MKRKLISVLLCGAMAATMLAGCGGSEGESSTSGSGTVQEDGSAADSGSDAEGGSGEAAGGTGKIGISMPTQSWSAGTVTAPIWMSSSRQPATRPSLLILTMIPEDR